MSTVLDTVRAWSPLHWAWQRIELSLAKHRSLTGHPRTALALARRMPGYAYDEETFFTSDDAPPDVVARRRDGLARLGAHVRATSPRTLAEGERLQGAVSDVDFVNAHRVPFQYRAVMEQAVPVPGVVARTDGSRVCDLDGNWSYDLGGSYGVNVFGAEFYKRNLREALAAADDTGLLLGPYHPTVVDNVERLRAISGLDEVSFHMSGTEAVMQAVRLARYHTGRSHVVRFCGAYHGWWDGVQAGPGNPRPAREVYTLEEMSQRTLRVLRTRRDIACVLVNPIQAMNPNGAPPTDSTLISNDRKFRYDRDAYGRWLRDLRAVCTERGIALVFDEVFLGFRLARGGVQEYFRVRADMVTYGKTLGGGLPVGVLCGTHGWMRRFREGAPADICFARGTFNAHPYVMSAMNLFLRHLDTPEASTTWQDLDARWDARCALLNKQLFAIGAPVRLANFTSIWTTLYQQPGRYHWMFQYYLRKHGLMPAWIGTGRFIFSHALTDADFAEIVGRFVAAAREMEADGWWWYDPEVESGDIKRRVARELLGAWLGRTPAPRQIPERPYVPPAIAARDA